MAGKGAKDLEIAALADPQYGVVSRAQLLHAGLTRNEIDHRVAAQRLRCVHRGVYAVGHSVLRVEGRWMAAVLACGEGAVLSHQTAASVWDLRRVGSGAIHVTVPGDPGRKKRDGIRLHRSTTLTASETTRVRGLPVTTPARTIIDLARTLSEDELERIVDEADRRGLVDFRELRSARSASLHAVLRAYAPAPTRSEMERRFLRLCRDHGIPRPETNTLIEGILVDFVWREQRFVVEVDGYRYHRAPRVFETDRAKDVHLTVRGWRVMRFTWRQITRRDAWVAAAVRTGARARAE
jgi:very-short-patch-repair endonuclease